MMTGNALWNIVGAAPEAILLAERALTVPTQLWFWIVGLALANAGAEYFALLATDLMAYPNWSPLLSILVYILVFWLIVAYTRWIWAPPAPWRPPVD